MLYPLLLLLAISFTAGGLTFSFCWVSTLVIVVVLVACVICFTMFLQCVLEFKPITEFPPSRCSHVSYVISGAWIYFIYNCQIMQDYS